jgi:hypothetical protein
MGRDQRLRAMGPGAVSLQPLARRTYGFGRVAASGNAARYPDRSSDRFHSPSKLRMRLMRLPRTVRLSLYLSLPC